MASQTSIPDTEISALVVIEGFRHISFPKIAIHRTATGKPLFESTPNGAPA